MNSYQAEFKTHSYSKEKEKGKILCIKIEKNSFILRFNRIFYSFAVTLNFLEIFKNVTFNFNLTKELNFNNSN